jgi:hypothetical protein
VVGYLCGAYRVSERHACQLLLLPRATHRYQSIRDPLTALRMRMRELAQARIRYGYRKIRVLLIREGWQVGKKLVSSVPRGRARVTSAAEGAADGIRAQSAEATSTGCE